VKGFSELADFFKALGDPTRLHILALLADGPHCVCELVEVLGVAQPTVSHHLHRLREQGLLKEERSGQWVFYRIVRDRMPLLDAIIPALPSVTDELAALARDQTLACHIARGGGRRVTAMPSAPPATSLARR
jgi:ArsR family transcriptional regulator